MIREVLLDLGFRRCVRPASRPRLPLSQVLSVRVLRVSNVHVRLDALDPTTCNSTIGNTFRLIEHSSDITPTLRWENGTYGFVVCYRA